MSSLIFLVVGLAIAVMMLSAIPKARTKLHRNLLISGAVAVVVVFTVLSSVQYVGANEVGIVVKNVGARSLPEGRIIAVDGEKGPQSRILGPGWHPWLWPVVYAVEIHPLIEIRDDEIGLITARDGLPMPTGHVFAPEWGEGEFQRMLDATNFLTDGGGYRGPQTSVLTPGTYRINPRLFEIERIPVTNIEQATVGVVKSNVGDLPPGLEETPERLVATGERGIWREPFSEQKLYINTKAYEITHISTAKRVVRYAMHDRRGEEREIRVRSADGFTFPVDVRVEFEIEPRNAPLVVARLGGDQQPLQEVLNSAVRAIFRNNAENVQALDYVRERSQQERQSLVMLDEEMSKMGVTVTAVRIGDVGDEQTLGALLKTQTDRRIAAEQQETFAEQQRAAEREQDLARAEQQVEEVRRLETARYEVQIAEEDRQRRVIMAQGEAEAIRIEAEAQAEAYEAIARQIGRANAATIEMLRIVGERGVQITPRVMVAGERNNNGLGGETTALIGTMLDAMISRDEEAGGR
ncbi:MAG: hypothetical protein EA376_02600 [Phycisphaeraceae bacterium]|nr:MAG: hypothetical protein EA376_02600 [Phycisphaeraceae bacterium]